MSALILSLEPSTQELCIALVEQAAHDGHPVLVCQALRTFEEQEALYAKGRTRAGFIVTQARGGESWHNYGRAFDCVFRAGPHGITWDGPWDALGATGKHLGLVWGGEFLHQDRPHFEYHPNLTIAEARVRARFPKVVVAAGPPPPLPPRPLG